MKQTFKRIAIWRTGNVGDMTCALPAIQAVARAFPRGRITLLAERGGSGLEVAERCTAVDEVHAYRPPRGRRRLRQAGRLVRYLRRRRFDALVYLAQDRAPGWRKLRDRLLCRLAGIPRCIGFQWNSTRWLRARRRPLPGRRASARWPNEVQRLLTLLTDEGIPAGPIEFALDPSPADRRVVDSLWDRHGLWMARSVVAVAPGSRMAAKCWPLERYAAVVEELIRRLGSTVLVIGGSEDIPIGDRLVRHVRGPSVRAGILNLCGSTSIVGCAELLRRCDLYLGNDTGPMHLAAAVGTPCVAVFSARDEAGAWDPHGDGHAVLRAELPCAGCLLTECHRDPAPCLAAIGAGEVVKHCLASLAGGELPATHRVGVPKRGVA